MPHHLRIAKPVSNLARTQAIYCKGLGLHVVGNFQDHEGFDGVMLGFPDAGYHFENIRRPAMTIHLDHTIVPARNKVASAKLLADLLGVPWAESGIGPFSPVYVNDGLTLDFIDTDEAFPVYHFASA